MTEAEWLACADPQPMLEFLREKASERKCRRVVLVSTALADLDHQSEIQVLTDALAKATPVVVDPERTEPPAGTALTDAEQAAADANTVQQDSGTPVPGQPA